MTTVLYAQPYDISATGFYFRTAEEYAAKAATARNDYGQPVEEFEIQFIDGDAIDAALAVALGIYIPKLTAFFEKVETWDDHEKLALIVAVAECGYDFDWDDGEPEDFDVDLYEGMSLRDLAEQFVADGVFGEIPERLAPYLDLDAIACDLGHDYAETEVAGRRIVYRCG
ncbi:MAG: antirestriction protein ArdA [Pseudomonadota bacterium]